MSQSGSEGAVCSAAPSSFTYPTVRRDETIVEDHFSEKIPDPYRWLEDPDSEETKAFVEAQNKIAEPYIETNPLRQTIHDRIRSMWDYPKTGLPRWRVGKFVYFSHNTGLQNQSVIYIMDGARALQSDHGTIPTYVKPSASPLRYEGKEGEPRVFLDPNVWDSEGTTAIKFTQISEDESLLAYGVSAKGSDWTEVLFLRMPSGELINEKLEHVKFSGVEFTHDNLGVFYSRYPETEKKMDGTETDSNLNMHTYYHCFGTPQSEDFVIVDPKASGLDPRWMPHAHLSDDGRYLLITIYRGAAPENKLWYFDLDQLPGGARKLTKDSLAALVSGATVTPRKEKEAKTETEAEAEAAATGASSRASKEPVPFVRLVDEFEARFSYIHNEGTVFTLMTNLNAPRFKLIRLDLAKPGRENWTDLVPEHAKDVLEWAFVVGKRYLILCYLSDVKNLLFIHDYATGSLLYKIPVELGSIGGVSGNWDQDVLFYQFSSFLTPGQIFKLELKHDEVDGHLKLLPPSPQLWHETRVAGFDDKKFVTEQVFYENTKDKTKVPMFIIHKKGQNLDGSNPCLLYGYGGFLISMPPYFSASRLVAMQHFNVVFAIANIRGGGEYGEDWHVGGSLGNKQNSLNDFQSAAEYLIREGYTSPKRLVINGGSNGGLLVLSSANQRPELFAAVVSQVAVADMLRFHKFTIGHAWMAEYGDPDKAADFQWLRAYSPLHNVPTLEFLTRAASRKREFQHEQVEITSPAPAPVQYPATLLLTGDHDDRVVPLHSFKFIAELQYRAAKFEHQTNPLLIRVDTKSGHGVGKPTLKMIDEVADIWSFVTRTLGLHWHD